MYRDISNGTFFFFFLGEGKADFEWVAPLLNDATGWARAQVCRASRRRSRCERAETSMLSRFLDGNHVAGDDKT